MGECVIKFYFVCKCFILVNEVQRSESSPPHVAVSMIAGEGGL